MKKSIYFWSTVFCFTNGTRVVKQTTPSSFFIIIIWVWLFVHECVMIFCYFYITSPTLKTKFCSYVRIAKNCYTIMYQYHWTADRSFLLFKKNSSPTVFFYIPEVSVKVYWIYWYSLVQLLIIDGIDTLFVSVSCNHKKTQSHFSDIPVF